jgi:hypothetical protein
MVAPMAPLQTGPGTAAALGVPAAELPAVELSALHGTPQAKMLLGADWARCSRPHSRCLMACLECLAGMWQALLFCACGAKVFAAHQLGVETALKAPIMYVISRGDSDKRCRPPRLSQPWQP